MENEIDGANITNSEEIVNPENNEPDELGLPADPVEVEPTDEDIAGTEALKQRNQELYEQLKKAKGFIRDEDGKWVKKVQEAPKPQTEPMAGITTEELYSLVKANVPDEDTREVKLWARSHGMTITEALKTPQVKALLGVQAEFRRTAEASNTNSLRRSASKATDETFLSEADKGNLPTDDEGIARLARLHANKRN